MKWIIWSSRGKSSNRMLAFFLFIFWPNLNFHFGYYISFHWNSNRMDSHRFHLSSKIYFVKNKCREVVYLALIFRFRLSTNWHQTVSAINGIQIYSNDARIRIQTDVGFWFLCITCLNRNKWNFTSFKIIELATIGGSINSRMGKTHTKLWLRQKLLFSGKNIDVPAHASRACFKFLEKKFPILDGRLEAFDFWIFFQNNTLSTNHLWPMFNWVHWTQKNDTSVLLGVCATAIYYVEYIFQ